jgi:hypothetical protein
MSDAPFFNGGQKRNVEEMIRITALFRDLGGLPPEGALVLSQLLLNLAGRTGLPRALQMVELFLKAGDVPGEWLV